MSTFHYNCRLQFTARLGGSKVLSKVVEHTSAAREQNLNGAIADGVVQLLSDPETRAYLAE